MKKTKNKELKRFKFPIDLIEFPIKYSKEAIAEKDDIYRFLFWEHVFEII